MNIDHASHMQIKSSFHAVCERLQLAKVKCSAATHCQAVLVSENKGLHRRIEELTLELQQTKKQLADATVQVIATDTSGEDVGS